GRARPSGGHCPDSASGAVRGDKFDLEAFGVLQERCVVVGPARVGVTVGVQLPPPVLRALLPEPVRILVVAGVESQMGQAGTTTVMGAVVGGLLYHEVGGPAAPTDPAVPAQEFPVAQRFQQPCPLPFGQIE